MSEATSQTAACEQLLDYVYDMLDAPQKAAFEQHLATCARCQAEAASFGKVRQATAKLMPDVEPPPALMGALHAQLMHAAAQRKPSRGKLLTFPRRIMQHPAWAAAAMFVIVGSAITINALRGKLEMPTASAPAPAMQPIEELPAPPAGNSPVAAPPSAAPANSDSERAADVYGDVANEKVELKKVAPAHKHAVAMREGVAIGGLAATNAVGPSGGSGAPAKPQRPLAKSAAADLDDRLQGAVSDGARAKGAAAQPSGVTRRSKEDESSLMADAPQAEIASAPTRNQAVRKERKSSASSDATAAAPSSAVASAPAAAPLPATTDSSLSSRYKGGRDYVTGPAAAASPPPPPMDSVVAPEAVSAAPPGQRAQLPSPSSRGGYYGAATMPAPKAAAPQQQTQDLHQRADALVRANRCDEAIKVYAELDRRAQRMSPKERASYVRCLTATGRQQTAEQQLDELKADKSVTNSLVQQAEGDVQLGRRSSDKAKEKAAKKSPADRAPPQSQPPYDEKQAPAPTATPAQQ